MHSHDWFHEYEMWTNVADGNNLQICMVSYCLMQLRQVSRLKYKKTTTYLKIHRILILV